MNSNRNPFYFWNDWVLAIIIMAKVLKKYLGMREARVINYVGFAFLLLGIDRKEASIRDLLFISQAMSCWLTECWVGSHIQNISSSLLSQLAGLLFCFWHSESISGKSYFKHHLENITPVLNLGAVSSMLILLRKVDFYIFPTQTTNVCVSIWSLHTSNLELLLPGCRTSGKMSPDSGSDMIVEGYLS